MKVRFQADADLNHIIVRAVLRREPAIDFQTAHAASLVGVSDQEVLAIAAGTGRVLVTHDRKTMPMHLAAFTATQTSSGVLIVSRKMPVAQVAEELLLIWMATEAEEWTNRIYYLPL